MAPKSWLTRRETIRTGAVAAGLLGLGVNIASAAQPRDYQVDFIVGDPIRELGETDDAFYGRQDRLIQYVHGDENGVQERDLWLNSLAPETRRCITADPIQIEGNTASVTFRVRDGCEHTLSLVAYTLRYGGFSFETADDQQLVDATTNTFSSGTHRLSVALPTGPHVLTPTVTGTDSFGSSLAIQGSTLLVGATPTPTNSGAAYAYIETDEGWRRSQRLSGTSTHPRDGFGWDIAVDGETAVISALYDSNQVGRSAGAVYIFERDPADGNWTQQQRLLPERDRLSSFGVAVDVSGSTALVTEPGLAAHLYERQSRTWERAATLSPTSPESNSDFGRTGSLSGDTAVVGATFPPLDDIESRRGAVYVFERAGGWSRTARLRPEVLDPRDDFARSVAIDGDRIAVGAPGDENDTGAVYLFERADGEWTRTAKLTANYGTSSDYFGLPLALNGDRLLVGGNNGRSVYLFERGDQWWTQQAQFEPPADVRFGFGTRSVELSTSRLAIGGRTERSDEDAVYITEL